MGDRWQLPVVGESRNVPPAQRLLRDGGICSIFWRLADGTPVICAMPTDEPHDHRQPLVCSCCTWPIPTGECGRCQNGDCVGGERETQHVAEAQARKQRARVPDERALRWGEDASRLYDALRQYEDEHPDDAPCLDAAMKAAGEAWREWYRKASVVTSHEPIGA